MENTKALIRELLTIINRNVGGIPENVQELYYKSGEEIKEVEKINGEEALNEKSKYQIEREKYQRGEDDEDEPFRWDGLD